MARLIHIKSGNLETAAELNETQTALAIWKALPIKAKANTWGDEIYFSIRVHMELEKAQSIVNMGDLGYWPTGSAFCIFFGPTPISQMNEIRPASAVTVFGKIVGDPLVFKNINFGEEIEISRQE